MAPEDLTEVVKQDVETTDFNDAINILKDKCENQNFQTMPCTLACIIALYSTDMPFKLIKESKPAARVVV